MGAAGRLIYRREVRSSGEDGNPEEGASGVGLGETKRWLTGTLAALCLWLFLCSAAAAEGMGYPTL